MDKIIAAIGRKKLFILGILFNAIPSIFFALASYSSSPFVYYYVSLFARSLSGIGDGMILCSSPVMIVTQYPDKKE